MARQQFDAALARLAASGTTILRRAQDPRLEELERAIEGALDLTTRINAWEWRWPLNTYHDRDPEKLSRAMRDRFALALGMTLDDYRELLRRRTHIRALHAGLAGTVEAAVALSAPGSAPLGLGSTGNPVFVVPGSLLGVPALSLPLLQDEGLPLGLQLLGFEHGDAALLGVAAWVEAALA
jgi:Asp-tRNA(Asn)/Glu-tRNA(Gln) amidotransferase A subunit family amidase